MHLAAKLDEKNPYFAAQRSGVDAALKSLQRPEQLFADGTFPPAEGAVVGFALVDYLIQSGGPAKYAQFLKRAAADGNVGAALQATYGAPPAQLAAAFAQFAAMRR